MKTKIDKLWELLKQPSTHKGLIAVVGAFGIFISPEHWEAILTLGGLAYGIYQIFRNEDKQIRSAK